MNESGYDEYEQARKDKWAMENNRGADQRAPHGRQPTYDLDEPVPNPIGEGKATSEIGDPGMPPFYRTMALFIGVVCALIGLLAGAFLL